MKTSITAMAIAMIAASPAAAKINVFATNIDFSAAAYTAAVNGTDSFTFTYDPRGAFDPDPVLINTAGSAQVTTVFGAPSVSFTDPPTVFGPNSFPGFSSVPDPTRAAFTLTASDIGLRYGSVGNYFYGYARFSGSTIETIAFQSVANVGILAGGVPEPATWGLLILGLGAVGGALRYRRRTTQVSFA